MPGYFKVLLSIFALVAAAVLLQSCATMSKEECIIADWRAVGERDGANGRSLSYFAEHVDSCKKTTALPDQAAWQEGHAIGARRYCTPENGLRAGNAGKTYHNICPSDLQIDFLPAYQLGRERYNLLSRRDSAASSISSNEAEIGRNERDIAKKKITNADGDRNIRRLRRENRELRFEIDDLDVDIRRLDRRIRDEGLVPPAAPAPIY